MLFLIVRRPPVSPRTNTPFPSATHFRSTLDSRPLLNADGEAVLSAILHGLPRAAARLEPKLAAAEPAVAALLDGQRGNGGRSEEHTSELQSLMRSSYAVFCLKKKK